MRCVWRWQVEYRERSAAVGRIPTTFNKREGAPKDREVLVARAVDRAVRPLFPAGYFYETQARVRRVGVGGGAGLLE